MHNFDYMKNIDINKVNVENLVDINDISVDKTLPKNKSILLPLRKIYCTSEFF